MTTGRTCPAPALQIGTQQGLVDTRFDDIFFMPGKGVEEGRHTFLEGTDLPDRMATGGLIQVGEIGLGTGLNFLLTWDLFLRSAPIGSRLTYWAVDAYPIRRDDLLGLANTLPRPLKSLAERLVPAWPCPTSGPAWTAPAPRIRLLIRWEPALEALTHQRLGDPAIGLDAWFLDGFAPAKAPEMWSQPVLKGVAGLTRPGGKLASFTAAGGVRRGLEAEGFAVTRRSGFGHKRHMISAVHRGDASPRSSQTGRTNALRSPDGIADVAVIGGGIAGVLLRRELAHLGLSTIGVTKSAVADGASGNPAGLVTPRMGLENTHADAFFRSAWKSAMGLYADLPSDLVPRRGVVLLDPAKQIGRAQKLVASEALPAGDLQSVDAGEASDLAGLILSRSGAYIPTAPIIRPAALTRFLAEGQEWRVADIVRIDRINDSWRLLDRRGVCVAVADHLVLTGGHEVAELCQKAFPIQPKRGQVTAAAGTPISRSLQCAVAGDGYFLPILEGMHWIGAGFETPRFAGENTTGNRRSDHRNLESAGRLSPDFVRRLGTRAVKIVQRRVGTRATTPDRLPLMGPVPDREGFRALHQRAARSGLSVDMSAEEGLRPRLWTLSGLGARGYLTAPLLAGAMAAEIAGTPTPMDSEVFDCVHPARFLLRDLKRGTT